jgi:DeoR/GlpR family transcriptional regulator of sugar metabolism
VTTGESRRGTRERQGQMLALVRAGTTHVEELAEALGVSSSTVRRDLGRLTRSGQVTRTYGGAISPDTFNERSVRESARLRRPAKAAIAAQAAPLVTDGSTVFIDAGTTCSALAGLLFERHDLTVVTRGLEVASQLASSPDVDVIILGGQLRRLSHGLVGPLTELALQRLSFEVAFLGADAVNPSRGIGEPTLEETSVKEQVAANSKRVIVLADSSKLRGAGPPAWAHLPEGWCLITDSEVEQSVARGFASRGIDLIIAGG